MAKWQTYWLLNGIIKDFHKKRNLGKGCNITGSVHDIYKHYNMA